MCNKKIREAAASAGVRLWRVADALGVTDSTFSKKLRKELSEADQERIVSIIDKLSREVNRCAE